MWDVHAHWDVEYWSGKSVNFRKFPRISCVFLYLISLNFPPNGNISCGGTFLIHHFLSAVESLRIMIQQTLRRYALYIPWRKKTKEAYDKLYSIQKLLGDTDNDLTPDAIASLAQDRSDWRHL